MSYIIDIPYPYTTFSSEESKRKSYKQRRLERFRRRKIVRMRAQLRKMKQSLSSKETKP